MVKILNFGSCNLDYVYCVNHIVAAGETETSPNLKVFPGGKGLNQSVALAKSGAKVFHAGCVGEDGEMLLRLMEENGIDISRIKCVKGKNGHAIIQVSDDGENSIIVYPGSNFAITVEFIDSVLADFGTGDILLLQNEINNVDLIAEKAYKKGMCIVFNPSPYNEKIRDVNLSYINYLILNEIEAQMFSGFSEAEQSLKWFAERFPQMNVVLTLGKRGSVYCSSSSKIRQAAFCAETVDTTAAGDTFTGYFIGQISEGAEIKRALRVASAAAAIAVSKNGAAPSIPKIDEVVEKMASMRENKLSDNPKTAVGNYIDSNVKCASLGSLAEKLGYSVTYTQKLVKKIYGKPFSKVVQEKKCVLAAKMLAETDLPIGEIINELGYENESFFRDIFKEKYGQNMKDYRKELKGL